MENDKKYLKNLGSMIQNIISDLKRTTFHISNELNIDEELIKNAINGELEFKEVKTIIDQIYNYYPISFKDIYTEIDDTNKGIIYFSNEKSYDSRRITKRNNINNEETEYYEYRDTALSRHSPFKPEWIKMLRVVNDSDPYNKDVILNKGHLLTQCTFFIGNVNFYYTINNKNYCIEMKTGDSNFITPYIPHSFTKPNNSEQSLIIAVTFSNKVRTNINDLLFTNINDINHISGNVRNKNELFLKKLYRQLDLKNISIDNFKNKLSNEFKEEEINNLLENGIFNDNIYDRIIEILNILPHELNVYDFKESDEVIIKYEKKDEWENNCKNLYVKNLASSKFFQNFSGSNNKIIGETEILKSSFHQYIYVYSNDITFEWGENLENKKIIKQDESLYIKPFVKYKLNIISDESLFINMKLCGELTTEYLDEFATFYPNGKERITSEKSKWW